MSENDPIVINSQSSNSASHLSGDLLEATAEQSPVENISCSQVGEQVADLNVNGDTEYVSHPSKTMRLLEERSREMSKANKGKKADSQKTNVDQHHAEEEKQDVTDEIIRVRKSKNKVLKKHDQKSKKK